MLSRIPTVLSAFFFTMGTVTLAQETEMAMPGMSEPGEAHKWLHQFEGEWESTMMAPGQTAEDVDDATPRGSMSCKMLGSFWLINSLSGEMGGGVTFSAIQTIGYDDTKKKYVGSWVDSMMNLMWLYEGTVDESGKKLMLEADGPNMMGGEGTQRYRDSFEFKSADHIILTSEAHDGEKWIVFMTSDIRRKK